MAAILYDLLNESPNIKIEISLANLIEAIDYSTKKTIAEREQERHDREQANTLVPRIETAKNLHTTLQTLRRWEQGRYLVPQRIGGKVFYKQADIQRILKQEGGNDL
ncbi:MAG: hypothetical protein LBR50_02930 [Tannerella sp.]|jgi:DNA-binding transcriptional regulator YiaG|nr:hypothetical protein [Tannerella sp.]